jgi:hypothetical protein
VDQHDDHGHDDDHDERVETVVAVGDREITAPATAD